MRHAVLLAAVVLGGCAEIAALTGASPAPGESAEVPAEAGATSEPAGGDPGADRTTGAEPGAAVPAASAEPAIADVPHVYMALQPGIGGQTSIVFAIDASRDSTPSDDPAIRLTPEETGTREGRCNPQQLRRYTFAPEAAGRPVYGPAEAAEGIGPQDLPNFMAMAVTSAMMAGGIAAEPEQTRPQNVCTRKLFEQSILAASTGQG